MRSLALALKANKKDYLIILGIELCVMLGSYYLVPHYFNA